MSDNAERDDFVETLLEAIRPGLHDRLVRMSPDQIERFDPSWAAAAMVDAFDRHLRAVERLHNEWDPAPQEDPDADK